MYKKYLTAFQKGCWMLEVNVLTVLLNGSLIVDLIIIKKVMKRG